MYLSVNESVCLWGVWAFGYVGLAVCEPLGMWALECVGLWVCGPLGVWAFGPVCGPWAFLYVGLGVCGPWVGVCGPLGMWALWFVDLGVCGPWDVCRVCGHLGVGGAYSTVENELCLQ